GAAIPRATTKEDVITRPGRKVVTKSNNAAKGKASTRPEVSTNVAKKTKSIKKVSGAGSSRQEARDKEVEPHVELSGDVKRTTRASFMHLMVGNVIGDVLKRDLLPFVSGPYYIPYPYDEGSGNDSPPYTKEDWEEIHGTHTIKKQNNDLGKQSELTVSANGEVSRLKAQLGHRKSKCQTDNKKISSWDKKHQKYKAERDATAVEKAKVEKEFVKTKSQLKLHERQAEQTQSNIASFFQSYFTPLVRKFFKSGEFNQVFACVVNTAIGVGVEHGLRMGRTDALFQELSQRVDGFIPNA
nr:hypothetical protein [Tanacetum cinerariifolium]